MSLTDQLSLPAVLTVHDQGANDALALKAAFAYRSAQRRYVGVSTEFASPSIPVRATSIKTTPVRDRLVPLLRSALAAEPANSALAAEHPALRRYFANTASHKPAHTGWPTDTQLVELLLGADAVAAPVGAEEGDRGFCGGHASSVRPLG